jgi:hypothetical protein
MAGDRSTFLDSSVSSLVDLADVRLPELMALMKPVATFEGFTDEQRQVLVLGWLSAAACRASGSALLLVSFGKVWDAEILTRSVFEGTLKFCHLLSDRNQFASRLAEYEEALPAISALADHDKVARLIDAMPDMRDALLAPVSELLLSPEERDRISVRYPKDARRRLQTAWGFTGLVEHMIRSGEGAGKMASGLLHGYAMASHVAHADYPGVGMIAEREYRSGGRRDAAHRAHSARVISDQLWYSALRLITGYRFTGQSREPVLRLMNDGSALWGELEEAQQDWFRIEYGALDSNGGSRL